MSTDELEKSFTRHGIEFTLCSNRSNDLLKSIDRKYSYIAYDSSPNPDGCPTDSSWRVSKCGDNPWIAYAPLSIRGLINSNLEICGESKEDALDGLRDALLADINNYIRDLEELKKILTST